VNTLVLIEVINGQNLSSELVTHEIKALNVAIGFHISKVIFNVISSLKNIVIIRLSWLALHNPQVDWCTRNFHFELLKHEVP
jgi:hypothetical protein